MPRLRFARVAIEIEVAPGTTVLEAARLAGAPVGSHCGGVCACSKCHVHVLRGAEQLSPKGEDERDMLELAARELDDRSRLGCQAALEGEGCCEVRITEESFEEYLDDAPGDRERAMRRWLARGG